MSDAKLQLKLEIATRALLEISQLPLEPFSSCDCRDEAVRLAQGALTDMDDQFSWLDKLTPAQCLIEA